MGAGGGWKGGGCCRCFVADFNYRHITSPESDPPGKRGKPVRREIDDGEERLIVSLFIVYFRFNSFDETLAGPPSGVRLAPVEGQIETATQ